MGITKNKQQGFSAVEIVIALAVIAVVVLAGIFVYRDYHKTTANSQTSVNDSSSAASKIANTLNQQKTNGSSAPNSSSSAGSDVIQNPIQTEPSVGGSTASSPANPNPDITFSAKYSGLQFTYPSSWSSKTWENDSEGSAITLTSADGNVLLSYGSPVVKPSNSCSSSSSKIYINDVQPGPSLSGTKNLYIVSYNNGTYNTVSLTDWDGQTPAIGQTDKCSSYQPAFINQTTGAYSWFKISDLSDSYRALDYSSFSAKADVKDAINIIKSAK